LPFEHLPTLVVVEWSGLNISVETLFESGQGISEREIMEGGVRGEEFTRRMDCAIE
jgi:hypothetical protein